MAAAPSPPLDGGGSVLPRMVADRLLADSDAIARRMTRRLAEDITLGPRHRGTAYLRAVMRACRDGLRALLQLIAMGRGAHPAELAALGRAGSQQAEMGVPLEVLLHGYRIAAKFVWREVVDEAVRGGELSPPTVVALSGQVLEYLDLISGAVGTAYLETRERLLLQRGRDRERVLARLLTGDGGEAVRRDALDAGLDLLPPYRAVAVTLERRDHDAGTREATAAPPRDPGALDRAVAEAWSSHRVLAAGGAQGTIVALVDPLPSPAELHRLLTQRAGPGVILADGGCAGNLGAVGAAIVRARETLDVGRRMTPAADRHDHAEVAALRVLALHPDAVQTQVSAVLGVLRLPRHSDLLATACAVVDMRTVGDAAAELGVHRHTVVYRLERIRALCGIDLDQPSDRARVRLALLLRRLLPVPATSALSDLPPPPAQA